MEIAKVTLGIYLTDPTVFLYEETFDADKSRMIIFGGKKFKGYQRENRRFNHKKHK